MINALQAPINQDQDHPLGAKCCVKQLQTRWQECATQAHRFHKQGKVGMSAQLFERCIDISLVLIEMDRKAQSNGIERYHSTAHNLAACYNTLQQAQQGEAVLKSAHTLLKAICQNPRYSREQRLDALATLSKSLFSFSAQLAYMGKTKDIHPLIMETERLAEECGIALGVL